jgi:transcriptional repressor NrdR
MRCPACAHLDDKVVDSRQADDGITIRRRRECLSCGARFTTFERVEEIPLLVLKRSGDRVPFRRDSISAGLAAAAKGRPVGDEDIERLVSQVEDAMRLAGPEVSSEQIGVAVLEGLRGLDEVAYMRFASVYKGFDAAADFQREIILLKDSEPKRH